MQTESNLTTEDLMTEVVQKAIKTWDLNRGDAQCLSYASHILWNMDSIECYEMYFDQKAIRQYFMDRFNPDYFQKAIEYVKAPPGSTRSHWVATAIFMFLVYDDILKRHFRSDERKEEYVRYALYSFLSNVTMRYKGNTIATKLRFHFTEKTDNSVLDQVFRNACRDKHEIRGRAFLVPNAVFQMDLSGGEILVYSYLLYCEDRKTFTCYPSYETIGEAVGMSKNTVSKYVGMLEKKGLIETSKTTIVTRKGTVHNGNLKYHILPIADAEERFDRRQMKRLQEESARERARKAIESYDEKHRNTPENRPN